MRRVSLPEFAKIAGRAVSGVWAVRHKLGASYERGVGVNLDHPDATAFLAIPRLSAGPGTGKVKRCRGCKLKFKTWRMAPNGFCGKCSRTVTRPGAGAVKVAGVPFTREELARAANIAAETINRRLRRGETVIEAATRRSERSAYRRMGRRIMPRRKAPLCTPEKGQ